MIVLKIMAVVGFVIDIAPAWDITSILGASPFELSGGYLPSKYSLRASWVFLKKN